MANLNSVLNEQIRRLARREIKANTRSTRKATAQYRRDIAALKRTISDLSTRLNRLEKGKGREAAVTASAPAETLEKARFRADGLRTHRSKLGLSAKDYGKLVGVSALTIYHWESGKARPRKSQMPNIIAVRGMGKREAERRLEEIKD